MISAEQHAWIRRLFYAEHWKIGTIAAELGLHPDTVRRAIESERFNQAAAAVRAAGLRSDTIVVLHPSKTGVDACFGRQSRGSFAHRPTR